LQLPLIFLGEIKTVSMFLFGNSHKTHWKLPLNKVVGILNPKIMEDRQSGNKGEDFFNEISRIF